MREKKLLKRIKKRKTVKNTYFFLKKNENKGEKEFLTSKREKWLWEKKL